MEKRSLGRCGIKIGEVGLGCEGLIGKTPEYVRAALDMMEQGGANGIDLYSPEPGMRSALGAALAGRRGRFVLQGHLCTIWQNGQYKRTRALDEARRGFDDQLERLGTAYLDVGMIHYVDSLEDWRKVEADGVLEWARQLKESGTIRAVGVSSHNPRAALRAVEGGEIDVLMFSINPCYDLQPADEDVEQLWNRDRYAGVLVNMDAERARLYETCQRLGVGITVMKAFGGGDLLKAEKSLAGVALTVDQCIAYALDRPAVACVFAGAHTPEELATSLDFAGSTPLSATTLLFWNRFPGYAGRVTACTAATALPVRLPSMWPL